MRSTYSKPGSTLRGSEEAEVRDVWNGFATYMRDDKGFSVATRRGYSVRAQQAHRWLRANGYKGLPWATDANLREFWNSIPPGASGRNHCRSGLVSFFEFVNTKGWRPDNPAASLPHTKVPRRLPRPIENTDAKKLLDVAEAMGPMVAAMVNIFAYCGLRNAELRGLHWSDLEGPWLRIIGKGNKERTVPVPPPAMLAIMRWRNSTSAAEWMFPSPRTDDRAMPKNTLAWLMRELSDTACVPFTPHVLRHTYATHMLEVPESDLRVVQEAMGHARPETTALYTKVRPGRLAEIANKMTY